MAGTTIKAKAIYGELTQRKWLLLFAAAGAVLCTFLLDIMTGPAWLSVRDVIFALFSAESVELTTRVIVWEIRLPVALMALIVGASLGLAGAEMQTILNNPLASPYTLGISSAAGFGAGLALVGGVGIIPYAGNVLISVNAFVFALLSSGFVYFIAKAKGANSETMILAGIALLFLFNALVALLQYHASEHQLQAVVFWLFGSLMKATWPKIGVTSVILCLIMPLFAKDAWKLTALRLGDYKARSLGINVERLRLQILVYISILTATAVCFVGTIGFIGLVAPHIARMLVGEEQRFFFPFSTLTGALLLSAASLGSKLLRPGTIYPIGIITAFIGVPFFLSIVLTKRRKYW